MVSLEISFRNHLPDLNYKSKNILEELVNYYIYKHYNLWTKYYKKQKSLLFKKIFSCKDKIKLKKDMNIRFMRF